MKPFVRPIIYQLFVRTFGNSNERRALHGTLQENGCGTLPAPPASDAAKTLAHINPMAHALGLFESLARVEDDPPPLELPLSLALSLRLQLQRVQD